MISGSAPALALARAGPEEAGILTSADEPAPAPALFLTAAAADARSAAGQGELEAGGSKGAAKGGRGGAAAAAVAAEGGAAARQQEASAGELGPVQVGGGQDGIEHGETSVGAKASSSPGDDSRGQVHGHTDCPLVGAVGQ
mmetsp:Transcript_29347/g.38597  ORF Transcript_29347/g.38597 Transcript_29347/m.38597 type:complete len:141 (+) Transcript_29347:1423-1845(+)